MLAAQAHASKPLMHHPQRFRPAPATRRIMIRAATVEGDASNQDPAHPRM